METAQITAMVDKLKQRLGEQPGDGEGWAMLARSHMVLGRTAEALTAYEKALALLPNDAAVMADYADALALRNDKRLEGEPMKWIEKALQIDPDQTKALSLAGTAAFDRKDFTGAVKHWERILRTLPADAAMAPQLRDSVAEARRLGGLPAGNSATGTAASAAPKAKATEPAMASATEVQGTVTLAANLASQAAPEDTVFVFARAAQGSRMPLAILRKQVKDLPLTFKLDDSLAMAPEARLSSQSQVIVGARVSKSGNAMPQPGDLQGQTEPVKVGSRGLAVVIDQAVAR